MLTTTENQPIGNRVLK